MFDYYFMLELIAAFLEFWNFILAPFNHHHNDDILFWLNAICNIILKACLINGNHFEAFSDTQNKK